MINLSSFLNLRLYDDKNRKYTISETNISLYCCSWHCFDFTIIKVQWFVNACVLLLDHAYQNNKAYKTILFILIRCAFNNLVDIIPWFIFTITQFKNYHDSATPNYFIILPGITYGYAEYMIIFIWWCKLSVVKFFKLLV